MSEEEQATATKYLCDKNLIANLQTDLQHIGILGEDENAPANNAVKSKKKG